MTWEELVKLALLGTDRGHLPDSGVLELKKMGIPETDSLARQVLQAAALNYPMQKAGFPLQTFKGALPKVLEAEGTKKCSARSAHHLNLVTKGTYGSALEEFIFHLQENKRIFPPENLPKLFQECLQNPRLLEKVRPVIGQKGEWLLRLNPEWSGLIGESDEQHWKIGNRQERVAFLANLRKHDPASALALLEETWEEIGLREQKALLQGLEVSLSLTDEAFLEQLLEARRKELRTIAADLLATLDRSALVKRIFGTLKDYLQFSETRKIDILLPAKLSASLQKDGIVLKPKQAYPGGVKAGWVGQMIARVPPHLWEDHLNLSAPDIIDLFEKSHWRDLFNMAITEACLRFRAPAWQMAIAQHWQKKQDESSWISTNGRLLLQQLSNEEFNTLVLRQIKESGRALAENSLASHLLCLGIHQWNDQVALQVIRGLQNLISEAETYYWNLNHYRRILAVGAYRCSAHLFEIFKKGWAYKSSTWPRWEKEVERFMRVLRFRMEMIAELQKT